MKPIFDVSELQHGDHVCLLHRSAAEQKDTLIAFIKEGITRHERCVYIVDEVLDPELKSVLADGGLDLLRLRQEGGLQILNRYETFLRYARFEPILMVELLEQTLKGTLASDFAGLRVIADMSWALSIGCDQLIAFEAMLNEYLPKWKMTYLCQYSRTRFASHILVDVLRTHPVAIVDGQVCPNFYYEHSALMLGKEGSAGRVDWMTNRLRQTSTLLKGCKY
jgi:DcmR-like sensory protein